MQKIILASKSKQRQALLSTIKVPFEIMPAEIDERAIRHEQPSKRAESIARAKAEKVAARHKGIVIAADTFSEINGRILEKPRDLNEAREMLKLESGNHLKTHTGFCYIDRKNNINFSTAVTADFKFRELSDNEIEEYIKTSPVTTWAAAFSPAYTYAMTMIDTVHGSLTGFTHGLPMEVLIPLLRKSGFEVHP